MAKVPIVIGQAQPVILSSAVASDSYFIDGREGSIQIETSGTVNFTAVIRLSDTGVAGSGVPTSTVYTTVATTGFQIPKGWKFVEFEITSYTTGTVTYTLVTFD